jgi:hypothetical protein
MVFKGAGKLNQQRLSYGLDNWGSIPSRHRYFVLRRHIQTGSEVHQALSSRVKRPDCEAHHSLLSSAEVTNARNYISTPPYVFMVWYLVEHRKKLPLQI